MGNAKTEVQTCVLVTKCLPKSFHHLLTPLTQELGGRLYRTPGRNDRGSRGALPALLLVSADLLQMLEELWKPNLEIYGLEEFTTPHILGKMAGLRITKNKWVKYDSK